MSQFELTSCRLAIQICIGHFPDGRERHRTFSIKNIRPDADDSALLTIVRAVGALLAYPVTRARLIVKKRRVLFGTKTGMGTKENAAPETRAYAPEHRDGINRALKTISQTFNFTKSFTKILLTMPAISYLQELAILLRCHCAASRQVENGRYG
jgi:hypothetical protein